MTSQPHGESGLRLELDDEHILEPMCPGPDALLTPPAPVIRDVHGRAWRIRRRSAWPGNTAYLAALAMLAVVIVVAWLSIF